MEHTSTFFERIGVNKRRMPLSGSMELTMRCNLRCAHCYLGDHRTIPAGQGQELSTPEIFRIFDQLAEAGTLLLLLTGGEPLLRPDFCQIWSYAKSKGFILPLFTNGTLLTPELADFLADLPPYNVEITLYGATQETYEKVTGIPGSYARCRRGIDLLLARSIPLKLKAMAMTLTVAELPAMQALADSLGVNFRFDPILNNDLDHKQAPLPLRLSPDEVTALDTASPQRSQEWRDFYARQNTIQADERYLYKCGAGYSAFHIAPAGKLSICMAARSPAYDLRQGNFKEGWEDFLYGVRFTPLPQKSACTACKIRPLCGVCPGSNESENVSPGQPVDYLCRIGHRRAQALGLAQ